MSCSDWKKNPYKDKISEKSKLFKGMVKKCKTKKQDFPNEDDCGFLKNTSINPTTGRKLKKTSKMLKQLLEKCSTIDMRSESLRTCHEWLESGGKINPRTRRRLSSKKGKVYLALFEECKEHGLSLKPLGVRFGENKVKMISPQSEDSDEYVLPVDKDEYVLPVDEDEYVLPVEDKDLSKELVKLVEEMPNSDIKTNLEDISERLVNAVEQNEQEQVKELKEELTTILSNVKEIDLNSCKKDALVLLMIKGIINRLLDDVQYPRRGTLDNLKKDERTRNFAELGSKTNFSLVKKFRDDVRKLDIGDYDSWDNDTPDIEKKCSNIENYIKKRQVYENIDNFVDINSKLSDKSRKGLDDDDVVFDEPKKIFTSRYTKN